MLRGLILSLLIVVPAWGQKIGRERGRYSATAETPGTATLLAYWEFDDADATGDSHSTNDWTDNGSDSQTGLINQTRRFINTQNDYGTIANASAGDLIFGNEDFTFCGWAYPENPNTARSHPIGLWPDNYKLEEDTDISGDLRLHVDGTGVTTLDLGTSGGTWTSTAWNFVCFWHDATNDVIGLQVDNSTAVTTSHTSGLDNTTTADFYFATINGSTTEDWYGRWDLLGVWSKVLTQKEKNYLYNSGAGRAYSDL